MNNDLEEFLRRTAAMRQQKAFEQRAEAEQQREQKSRSRPKPYSNARRERQVDSSYADYDEDDETLVGIEILDEGSDQENKSRRDSANTSASGGSSSLASSSKSGAAATHQSSADMPAQLRAVLARPDGVRQAFLLREILNRPRF